MEPPLGRRLYLGQRAVAEVLDQRLGARGASLWNWVLLREASLADGASQRELAQRMGIEPPTLVRHLDKLADDGFVERRQDPDDRRVLRVVVTPRGRSRLAALHEEVQWVDRELRALLTEREIDVLGKALMRIHDHFSALQDDEGETRRVRQR
jgi:MarR family transcriptional regulator, transcriptional regulator for hemolysin